jgi:hypothetical protein
MSFLSLGSTHVDAQAPTTPLTGVRKGQVFIVLAVTGNAPSGLSEDRVRTILELRLRQSGVIVLTPMEDLKDPTSNPYFLLEVTTLQLHNMAGTVTGTSYFVRLSVRIVVPSPLGRSTAPLELWETERMGVAGLDGTTSVIEASINARIDEFLNAWLAANPQKAS